MSKNEKSDEKIEVSPPRKFYFKLKGIAPIISNKPCPEDVKKGKTLDSQPKTQQARDRAYWHSNGNLGVPQTWLKGSMVEAFIRQKTDSGPESQSAKNEKQRVCPNIRFEPLMFDLKTKDYTINESTVLVKQSGTVKTMVNCVRPLIENWEFEGTLVTTLPETAEELRKNLEYAGYYVGIGSNKINGFGRFEVVEFRQV